VVAYRGHHLLPRLGRREPKKHPRRPVAALRRREARQDRSTGDAALAPRTGPLRDPEVRHPARIAENIDIFDFELSNDELAAIDVLDTGVRGGPDPESITLEQHGFAIPEANEAKGATQ
jgi:hypothetical protein